MSEKEKYSLRKKALSEIKLDEWLVYNPLFKTFTPEFSESFNRGSPLDLRYYVKRMAIGSSKYYEDELCESLFPTSNVSKLSYLTAKVGNGKTSLCRYISMELNKKEDCLAVYMDIGSVEKDTSKIKEDFKETILETFRIKGIDIDKRKFCEEVLKKSGFGDLTPIQILDRYDHISVKETMEFIDNLSVIQKVLIIIDNIDECAREIIVEYNRFAEQLHGYCNNFKKIYSILLPAREHTVRRYFDQNHFADNHLAPVDELEIVKIALCQSIDKIENSTRQYTQSIEYPKINGPYSVPFIKITITKEYTLEFLSRLIKDVRTTILWFLCRSLSNKNYKFMINNMYNFIHSCKLPIVPLFNHIYLKNYYKEHRIPTQETLSFDVGLETLLAIHYPFFDKKASYITNVFDLSEIVNKGDYKNTLTIIRLLCFLQNNINPLKKLSEIIENFKKYWYTEDIVRAAIGKCFEYGLIDASHGIRIKDLSDDSEINISSIGRFYIDILICNHTYLCFMADDTPMPVSLCEDIYKKYRKNDFEDTKFRQIIIKASNNFINFINGEEESEKLFIKDKGYDYNDFLLKMSFKIDSQSKTISEYIKSKIDQSINIGMLANYL